MKSFIDKNILPYVVDLNPYKQNRFLPGTQIPIYDSKKIQFKDCFLIGLFAAFGFLSKYLFIYLLVSIELLFIW